MCKDGKPCNDAGKQDNNSVFFSRLEMLIVMAELYQAQGVQVPHAANGLLDVVGPLLMDTIKKAKGWNAVEMAQAIIKQKRQMFADSGVEAPAASPLETIVDMLAGIMAEAEKAKAKRAGGKSE